MARDRSISVTLKASVQDYLSGMRQAKAATADFASSAAGSATKHKADWQTVGRTVAVAGLAIAAGVGYALNKFAEFDQAMSAAGAASNATAGDLDKLRAAALQAGQDTAFSATEAAQAITELAKAGVSTSDILGGGLAGALDLAAAGQLDVAKAAELAATAMTVFKLSGEDLPHVADLLAAGAGKAQGSVEDLGMALKQSGLVAKQSGLTIEETTGALAAFASAGLVGSDAGTSFKSMLQRLTPTSAEAKKEMERLGISAFDAQGNFIGLEAFAGNLQTSLQGLTVEQRNAAMATIFGSDAVRAAAVLYDNGAAGIAKWTANVNDAGFAQRQAARLTDNWRGDLERLSGSIDTALIKGGSGANDALRSLTQGLEGVVNGFNGLSPAVQSSVVYMAAAAAGIALVGGGAMIAVPKIRDFNAAISQVSIGGLKASSALKALGVAAAATAAISIGGAQMQTMWLNVQGASDDATKSLETLIRSGRDAQGVTRIMRDGFQDLGQAVNATFNPSIWHGADAAVRELGTAFGLFGTTITDDSIEFFREMDSALAGFVSSGRGDEAANVFRDIAAEAQNQGYSLDQVKAVLPQYAAALDGATVSGEAAAAGTETASEAVEGYLSSTNNAKAATDAFVTALKGLASPILDASAAAQAWEAAIDSAEESLAKNGRTLDITTAKGRDNKKALDDMARAAIENASAMAANGATQGQLQAVTDASRGRLEAMARSFGMSDGEARDYANTLLRVPPVVNTIINANTASAQSQILAYARSLTNIPREINTIVRTTQIAQRMDAAPGLATGGYLEGPGTKTSDSIPIQASRGEYVVRAAAVDKYGVNFMHQVNAMRFADGGLVDRAMAQPSSAPGVTRAARSVAQTNHYYGVTDAQMAADRARADLSWELAR